MNRAAKGAADRSRTGWLLALVCLAPLLAGNGLELEGRAEVQVIGGNLVSARKRALRLARQDAVARAVAARLTVKQLDQLQVKLKHGIYRRARRYVRTYRVLEEANQGRTFRIRVAVLLNTKRLQGDLNKIVGRQQPGPGADASKAKVGLWIKLESRDAAMHAPLLKAARDRLLAAGFGLPPVVLRASKEDDLRARAQAAGASILLKVKVTLSGAKGIRGLDLTGARARVEVWLGVVDAGTRLAGTSADGWGAAELAQAARLQASERGLARALEPALAKLKSRLSPGAVPPGHRLIHVSGLSTFAQHQRITHALKESITGVQRCALRRLSQAEAWYAVRTNHTASRLAGLLVAQSFATFSLKTKSVAGGTIWLTVEPAPEPAPAPAPAP